MALARILEALGQELIDASDEEILEAARDLGIDPTMKGSAAFAGLKFPATPRLSDFFELDVGRRLRAPEADAALPNPNTRQEE
jgi:hypothetical protein